MSPKSPIIIQVILGPVETPGEGDHGCTMKHRENTTNNIHDSKNAYNMISFDLISIISGYQKQNEN
jgi:hypothetical protein